MRKYLLPICVWIIHSCSSAHGESPVDYPVEVQKCIEALNTNCVNKLVVTLYSARKNRDLPCNYLIQSWITSFGDCNNRRSDVIANEMFAALRSLRESGIPRSTLLQFEEKLRGAPHVSGEEGDHAVLYRMVAQRAWLCRW